MTKFLLIILWGGAHGGPAMESFTAMEACMTAKAKIEARFNSSWLTAIRGECIEVPK